MPGLNLRPGPAATGTPSAGPKWNEPVSVVAFNPAGTWAQLGGAYGGKWVCYACPEGGSGAPFLTPA
jgi:hypothetical protein